MSLGDYWPTLEEEPPYTGPFSTYPEIHAFTIGLGVGVLLVAGAYDNGFVFEAVAAVYVRIGYYALTGTRLKTPNGTPIDVPRRLLGQINHEPHYYLLPASVGFGIALVIQVV